MYGGTDEEALLQKHFAPVYDKNFAPEDFGDSKNFVPAGFLKRVKLNTFAIAQAILLPWLLFVGILWLLSSQVRYYHPIPCCFLVACGFLFPVGLAARVNYLKSKSADVDFEPTWLSFLAATGVCACILALLLGECNYYMNMIPYHTLQDLAIVSNVNPVLSPGKAYLDASIITFQKGSVVNQKLSMGYKSTNEYCVAPITIGTDPLASYDYWAVGVNCCNAFGGEFWCGTVNGVVGGEINVTGTRLVDDALRPYYHLAIQQATAEYNIHVGQPIFLNMVDDMEESPYSPPAYKARANRFLWIASVVGILVQTCLVVPVVSRYSSYLS